MSEKLSQNDDEEEEDERESDGDDGEGIAKTPSDIDGDDGRETRDTTTPRSPASPTSPTSPSGPTSPSAHGQLHHGDQKAFVKLLCVLSFHMCITIVSTCMSI